MGGVFVGGLILKCTLYRPCLLDYYLNTMHKIRFDFAYLILTNFSNMYFIIIATSDIPYNAGVFSVNVLLRRLFDFLGWQLKSIHSPLDCSYDRFYYLNQHIANLQRMHHQNKSRALFTSSIFSNYNYKYFFCFPNLIDLFATIRSWTAEWLKEQLAILAHTINPVVFVLQLPFLATEVHVVIIYGLSD